MARPQKKGLDYFPLDVTMDKTNDDIEMLEGKYATNGFKTIIKLYMKIYQEEGYFIKWCEKSSLLLAKRVNVHINEVKDIINDLVKWGVFDEIMYDEYKILTSRRIQKTYFDATKNRKEVIAIDEYMLVEIVNDNINLVNVGINPQSKEKETKVKKKKEEKSKAKKDESSDSLVVVELSPPTDPIITSPKIDYSSIANYFNTHSGLKEILRMTSKRKTNIDARIKEYKKQGGIDVIYKVIDNTRLSPFMKGSNKKNWVATFDWIFGHPNNFVKVYEGNYVEQDYVPNANNNLQNRANNLKNKFGSGKNE